MKKIITTLGFCSLASMLLAAGAPVNRKTWAAAPEAYFLTAEERAAWKKVANDDEARQFVARYLAERGDAFEPMLRERIAIADKYFAAGKTRGSETLRGKVIILFGPPSRLSTKSGRESQSGGHSDRAEAASGVPDPHSNVGPGVRGLAVTALDPIFTLEYDEAQAPRSIGKAFRVDLKMKSDALQEPLEPKDLEEKFETVARASRLGRTTAQGTAVPQ